MDSLGAELKIKDENTLAQLRYGLLSAKSIQDNEGKAWTAEYTLTEYRQSLEQLIKALQKIIDGRGSLEAAQRSVNEAMKVIYRRPVDEVYHTETFIDICKWAKRIHWDYETHTVCEVEFLAQSLHQFSKHQDRQRLAGLLLDHAKHKQANLRSPGRGGRRTSARAYLPGILELARQFSRALPSHSISANANSVFYRYVCFWFEMTMNLSISAPSRHIQAAIEHQKTVKIFL